MTSIFAQRRAALAAQLGHGGVAIIPTAPERARNRDSDFPYRHDSYFYYLTGFSEAGAWSSQWETNPVGAIAHSRALKFANSAGASATRTRTPLRTALRKRRIA
jgi:Xaa-Pro aminopeptidase